MVRVRRSDYSWLLMPGDKMMADDARDQDVWIWHGKSPQADLVNHVHQKVADHIEKGHYTADEVKFIAAMDEMPVKGAIAVSDERLEKLRRLCQVWEVDLRYRNITSHRRIIGPIIVAFKKLLYPVIRAIFKDYIRQQKEFNAAAIAMLADLSNEENRHSGSR